MASGGRSGQDIPRGLVNRTGTPLGRGSRLPSVRGQRDLTLGGIQRKVFTPNLSAKKKPPGSNESKGGSAESASPVNRDREAGGRGRGKSERGRGRGRGRGEDRTIQLQSEFAYGPMGGASSGWSRSSGGGGGGGGGGSSEGRGGESSTVIRASMRQAGSEDDKALLDTLLRDDFVSDISPGEACMAPIRLPLNVNTPGIKSEVKKEVKVELTEPKGIKLEAPEAPSSQAPPSGPVNMQDILFDRSKSEHGQLLLLQFPDTLPGLPADVLGDTRPGPSSAGDAPMEAELSKRLEACYLQDCPEGFVGRLCLRRSGRVELVLGDNRMQVLPGIPINFHQELVSVRADDSPGQMVALGPVDHKLVVTPDYNHLISRSSTFS